MGAPAQGRITLSSQGVAIIEKQIEYRLNSTMTIRVQGLDQVVTFDGCELYRPGDRTPFLRRSFEPIRVGPAHSLELAWAVSGESSECRQEDSNLSPRPYESPVQP